MAMTMVNYLKESKWKRCILFTENKPSVLHASCAAGWYDIVEILLTFYAGMYLSFQYCVYYAYIVLAALITCHVMVRFTFP